MKNPLVAHHSGVCQNLSDKIQLPSEYQECLEEKGQEVAALDRSQFVVFLEQQQQHNSSCWDVRNWSAAFILGLQLLMMYAPLFLCQQNEVLFRRIVNWGNQSKAELHSLSVEEQDLQESWKDAAKTRRTQNL
jgi:hypothetical protein